MRRTISAAVVALVVLLVDVTSAYADKHDPADPSRIGDNVKDLVAPNAKAFWWVLLVGGLLFMAASRRAGRAVATGVLLIISGIAIYNPAGVGSMMSALADRIV